MGNKDFIAEIVASGIAGSEETLSTAFVKANNDLSSFLATMARFKFVEASFMQSGCVFLGIEPEKIKALVDAVQKTTLAAILDSGAITVEELSILYPDFKLPEGEQALNIDEVRKAMKSLEKSVVKIRG